MTGPEQLKAWLDAVDGDERFLLTLGAGIVNTGLLIAHLLDMGTYATLTLSTVGAFIAAVAWENKKNVATVA